MNPHNTKQVMIKDKKVSSLLGMKNKQICNNMTALGKMMDVYFVFTPSGSLNKDSFQARNFVGTKRSDWKLEIKGEFAAQEKFKDR